MVWAAAIPAIISAVGSLAGGMMGRSGQQSANEQNIKLAREQMQFQERMSNTEYQRSREDLRAAGFNPMLSFMRGSGASTPSGSLARVENEMEPVANSAKSAMDILANLTLVKAQARKLNAEAKVIETAQPFQQGNETFKQNILEDTSMKLQQEISKLEIEIDSGRVSLDQARELKPLMVKAQELINESLRRGMSRKQLEENVSSMFNLPFEYGGLILDKLGQFGEGIGGGVADFQDWLNSLKDRVKERYNRNR